MRSKPIALTTVLLLLVLAAASRGQSPSARPSDQVSVEPSRISEIDLTRSANQKDATKEREKSITGRVLNESGQPMPHASIFVRKLGAQANSNRSLGTDQDGFFHADDLAPGVYSVFSSVSAYVPASESANRQYYRPGETVTLRMIKGGVITGTVTNAEGEPVIAVRVSAIRVRDAEGRPITGSGAGTVGARQTDDRGVYRIFGLPSGSYLIQAGGGGVNSYPPSAVEGDAPTYHPSTTRDAAAEVTVRTGDEVSGIDVRYRGEGGHIISGSISGSFGSDANSRAGASVVLTRSNSGAIEANSYAALRSGERGFALYGVPDGEYDLYGFIGVGTDTAFASAPRRVTVKGSDVTGIELALAPLGAISGRIVSDRLPESERKGDCKGTRSMSVEETLITPRRDEKSGNKGQIPPMLTPSEGAPDEKGEFKIFSMLAGRYRFETRLPNEDWFVRSITIAGPSKQQNDVMAAGLAISSGQRATDVTVTIAEGAAGLRGKIAPASEGAALPPRLRVHLVPADVNSADDVVRYGEVPVENDSFSMTNLASGRYFVLARAISDEEFNQRSVSPVAWDATTRAKLRREAEAANVTVELQRCQRVEDFVLKYSAPRSKKPASGTKQ